MSMSSISRRDSNMPKLHNSYFNRGEVQELLALGEACYVLMEYYYQIHYSGFIKEDSSSMTDEAVIDYTGWSLSKVKRARLKLAKNGWIHRTKFTKRVDRVKTQTVIVTYLGKQAVINNKVEALTQEEFSKISPTLLPKGAKEVYDKYSELFTGSK
jgi:mevalonate kinase